MITTSLLSGRGRVTVTILLLALLLLPACSGRDAGTEPEMSDEEVAMTIELTSTAFNAGRPFRRFTPVTATTSRRPSSGKTCLRGPGASP